MTKSDFQNVRAALVEDNQHLRGDLRAALAAKGLPEPILCRDTAAFLEVAGNETLDLIICDANTLGDEFSTAIQRIRRHDLGGNPFAVAIATAHDASVEGVRTALDSGVDDLLLKPVPVMRIIDRIDHLVWDRRPFIVTKGYVGPTRRNAKRPSDDSAVALDAPNTLHAKVVDKMPEERIARLVAGAVSGLQEKMVQHPLLGIDRLIQRTLALGQGKGSADELRRDFGYLMKLGVELSNRYRGTAFAHIAELAIALAHLARRIANHNPGELRRVDLDPLSNLGEVIRRSLAAEERAADAAHARGARIPSATRH